MAGSEKRDTQQKKSRKASSICKSSTEAPAAASPGSPCTAAPWAGAPGAPAPGHIDGIHGDAHAWPEYLYTRAQMYPPGGFMNYLQRPQTSPLFPQTHPFLNHPNASNLPENFHFVGAPNSRGTPSPPGSGLPMDAAHAQMGSQEKETIGIDDDDTFETGRSEKRLSWSHEEDVRLVSAWLQNSLDPVDGNGRKSDKYWADVTDTYNSNTASNRKRNRNQLKIRWDRIKKPVSEFHGCWVRTTRVYQSGMSDDQMMDNALQMYASEHGEKPFLLQHIWRVVRHERKWAAYVKKLNQEKEKNATPTPAHVVNLEDPKQRPVGHKRAKDERNGKRKTPEALSLISEKLDKFIEASTMARKDREKMSHVQHSLADKKVEAAKLTLKAVQEQTKAKMLDTYKELMFAPTSHLSAEAVAERDRALESMRLSLFANHD